MSSKPDSDDAATLGARSNFFDSQDAESYDTDRDPGDETEPSHDDSPASTRAMLGRDPDREVRGADWRRWISEHILRAHGNPAILCPACLYELDAQVELTEPRHYLPYLDIDHDFDTDWLTDSKQATKHDHRRHRHCPQCNVVSFGGIVADRPAPEFLEVVDTVLDALDEREPIPAGRRRELWEAAARRKEKGTNDQSNLEQLLAQLQYGRNED